MSQLATNGVIAENEERARIAIAGAVASLGLTRAGRSICVRCRSREPGGSLRRSVMRWPAKPRRPSCERSGELDGLSKKEAKQLTSERGPGAVARAGREDCRRIAARVATFATVEAANGYVNISFDPMVVACGLVSEVLDPRASTTARARPKPNG